MGTNFYIHNDTCKHCGRGDEGIHLGKSSAGWSFALQANGFQWYKNWEQMKKWLQGKQIKDEYGDPMSTEEFIEMVEKRKDTQDPETDWGSHGPIIIEGYKFFDHSFS